MPLQYTLIFAAWAIGTWLLGRVAHQKWTGAPLVVVDALLFGVCLELWAALFLCMLWIPIKLVVG